MSNINPKNNVESTASLRDLMTAAPITAEAHAQLLRIRNQNRRMVEESKEERRFMRETAPIG